MSIRYQDLAAVGEQYLCLGNEWLNGVVVSLNLDRISEILAPTILVVVENRNP
jgi:hypothetical protein